MSTESKIPDYIQIGVTIFIALWGIRTFHGTNTPEIADEDLKIKEIQSLQMESMRSAIDITLEHSVFTPLPDKNLNVAFIVKIKSLSYQILHVTFDSKEDIIISKLDSSSSDRDIKALESHSPYVYDVISENGTILKNNLDLPPKTNKEFSFIANLSEPGLYFISVSFYTDNGTINQKKWYTSKYFQVPDEKQKFAAK